jgi:hypothetical protein
MYFIHLSKDPIHSSLTLKQFKQLVLEDDELTYTNKVTYQSPYGEQITKSGGHYALWNPTKDKKVSIYFWYEDNAVHAIYDTKTLEKFHKLSSQIDGIVEGDLGEEY